jgi:hypothetical protein
MTRLGRAGLALAALLLCASTTPAAATSRLAFDPDPDWRHAPDLPALRNVLEDWLDTHSDYARRDAPVRIEIVDRMVARAQLGLSARMGQVTRGLYDPDSATIYLIAPWSARDARDVSVLLHELVHHRQVAARHWYCPGAHFRAAPSGG